jgi:glycosyltransferase involved in cell wall biosynthesis
MNQPIPTISAVIITFNEEKNIERCIRSLKGVVDEIVIWDSFSTDQTKKLSQQLGAVVYDAPWEGYSVAKNKANNAAKGDFILSIDADEELSPELRRSLMKIKPSLKDDAYIFTRINNYCGTWIKHSGWYPEYKTRLFKKGDAFWVGEIHERLEFINKPNQLIVTGDLLHYSILSLEHHIKKMFLYGDLSAKKDFQNGVRPSIIFHGILKPSFHFIKNFILQRGFLDGYIGFVIAKMAAFERFLRYVKLKELYLASEAQKPLRVIQMSSEATWRGGEQQIAYLIDELKIQGIESIALVKKNSSFEEHCRKKGIPYYASSFQNSIDFFTVFKLCWIARKEKASIVHIHSSKSHSLAVLATLFGLNVPLVLSRRVDFKLSNSIFSDWKYNHPQIKKTICVSNAIANILKPHLRDHDKCITIYDGVDIIKFKQLRAGSINILREEFKIDKNQFLIGNTSALVGHKDYYTFIDTIEKLLKKNLPVTAFIIGKGPLEKDLKQYVIQKGVESNIIFTGFKDNVTALLPCLDLFLFTSNEEGLGSSVLDAFTAKVPVVATAAGGIPEIVKHEQTGLLAPPKDSTTLAAFVERIMHDEKLREYLKEEAYLSALTFSKEETATKTRLVYKEVIQYSLY